MEPDRYSVSISDDASTVVVGEPGYDGDRGRVCVYDIAVSLDESSWNRRGDCLTGLATGDQFGYSVSNLNGQVVAVGAPYGVHMTMRTGYVAVYSWDPDDRGWTLLGEVINGFADDQLAGQSVDINDGIGLVVIVGAPGYNSNAGTWFCMEYDDATSKWSPRGESLLVGAAGDQLGKSVSIRTLGRGSATIVAIGAPQSIDAGNGYVQTFAFSWDEDGEGSWMQLGSNFNGIQSSDYAGYAVSLSGGLPVFLFSSFVVV